MSMHGDAVLMVLHNNLHLQGEHTVRAVDITWQYSLVANTGFVASAW